MKFNLIRCDKCHKYINIKSKRPDGLPTMIQLVDNNGKVISVCADCVNVLGRAVKEGRISDREQFFAELDDNMKGGNDNECD